MSGSEGHVTAHGITQAQPAFSDSSRRQEIQAVLQPTEAFWRGSQTMKNAFISSLFLVVALYNPVVTAEPAQVNPITPVVGLDPIRGTFNAQPGTYNFMSYDGTFIQAKTLDRVFQTRDADKTYYLAAMDKMNKGLENLLRYTIYYSGATSAKDYPYSDYKGIDGLMAMSENALATTGGFVEAKDFLAAVRRFKEQRDVLLAQIETLRSITTAFPSQQPIVIDGKEIKIPSYGELKMDEIADFYKGRLATLETAVSKVRHKIKLPNGNFHLTAEGEGLVLTAKAFFNPAELAEARRQRTELLRERADERQVLNKYSLYSKQLAQDFVNRFWDRYRLQTTGIKDDRREQAEYLARLFWTRSYLRATYGTRLGGIGISYEEKAFNLDIILNSNKSLMNFHKEIAWSDKEVQDSLKAYRNIVTRLQERTGQTFPPIQNPGGIVDNAINGAWYLGGNTAYVITFLAGNPNLAQALTLIMRQVSADMYEEYVLTDPTTGQDRIIEMYKQRYKNSAEGKKQAEAWEDAFDASLENSLGTTAGSAQDAIRPAIDTLKNRADRWQQSKDQLAFLKAFEESNEFLNKVLQDRKNRLRE